MKRLIRLARTASVAVAILFVIVHLTPLTAWITLQMVTWDEEPKGGGVLIVLGAEQNADGTLGLMSYWRCIHAVHAWRTGKFSKVLVSGGPSNGTSLAGSMAEFLKAFGVPKADLILEAASTDTKLNAAFAAPLVRSLPGPYTLVTSDFHTLRARHCFRRAGIPVNCQPAPDILKRSNNWRHRWHCSIVLAEEWVKIVYYWWNGWI